MDGNLALALGVEVVLDFLLMVPCISVALLSRRALVAVATLWLVYCVAFSSTGVDIATFSEFYSPRPAPPPGEFALTRGIVNLSQGVTVFATLLLYRWLGFRLVRARAGGGPAELE